MWSLEVGCMASYLRLLMPPDLRLQAMTHRQEHKHGFSVMGVLRAERVLPAFPFRVRKGIRLFSRTQEA